jgi:pyrimidine deaminase RibD-like protein/riboflavin biosynthesis pyrimidine reductase
MMYRALALARRGVGSASPNPMVGALVVQRGAIIGVGWHRCAGAAHAEVEALNQAGSAAKGGDLYVSLEPCNHQGKTPPCTEAILRAGVKRVFYAMDDPNPNVSGGGAERLKEEGLLVISGMLSLQASEINAPWLHWLRTGEPLVLAVLKVSLDSRDFAPAGLFFDSSLSHAAQASLLRLARAADVLVFEEEDKSKIVEAPQKKDLGAWWSKKELIGVSSEDFRLDRSLLSDLGARGKQLLLLLCGAKTTSLMLKQGLLDRVLVFRTPGFGGDIQPGSSPGLGAFVFDHLIWSRRVGRDALSYYVV